MSTEGVRAWLAKNGWTASSYHRFLRYGPDIPEKPERCEVCLRRTGLLHVDHHHGTGRIRGWLCGPCNRAAGLLSDSPSLARRLADYLEN